MSRAKVLIIDDDKHICQILSDYFNYENFTTVIAHTGEDGINKIEKENPDIIILDIMLPGMDGWEICQKLRPRNQTPIIFLSARTRDTDRITGLEIGGDDYVTKPFSPKEVVVRAKAVLRRVNNLENNKEIEYPNLVINKNYRLVKAGDKEISLTPKEFDLLWTLALSPRNVFGREKLLNEVWGYDYYGDIRTVDTHIKSLRKKLTDVAASYIKTVWGVGYKFEVNNY